jgi:hypothetical protein
MTRARPPNRWFAETFEFSTAARDAAIAFSFAVQHGADAHAIRRSPCGRPIVLAPPNDLLGLAITERQKAISST